MEGWRGDDEHGAGEERGEGVEVGVWVVVRGGEGEVSSVRRRSECEVGDGTNCDEICDSYCSTRGSEISRCSEG